MKQIKKALLFFTLTLIISFGMVSCDDFIEKDISGEIPVLILPQDGDTISEFSNFIWKELEGATKYHLEIYSPSFTSPNYIAIDTILTTTDIFFTLTPNKYQLRLSALNNGYESLKTDPIEFTVDTIPSNQLFIDLLMPISSAYYPESYNGLFSWSSLPNISSYEMSLRTGSDYQTGAIIYSQNNITTTNHTVSGVTFDEGEYAWGVKANLNNGNSTNVFTSTFKIDGTSPGIPFPVSPLNNSIELSPIEFSWTNLQDVGSIKSPITTHLELASDTTFTTIIESDFTQSNSIDITINNSGIYFWRLYNMDEAGNQSGFSPIRKFTIN